MKFVSICLPFAHITCTTTPLLLDSWAIELCEIFSVRYINQMPNNTMKTVPHFMLLNSVRFSKCTCTKSYQFSGAHYAPKRISTRSFNGFRSLHLPIKFSSSHQLHCKTQTHSFETSIESNPKTNMKIGLFVQLSRLNFVIWSHALFCSPIYSSMFDCCFNYYYRCFVVVQADIGCAHTIRRKSLVCFSLLDSLQHISYAYTLFFHPKKDEHGKCFVQQCYSMHIQHV